jgi:hypothetical protein
VKTSTVLACGFALALLASILAWFWVKVDAPATPLLIAPTPVETAKLEESATSPSADIQSAPALTRPPVQPPIAAAAPAATNVGSGSKLDQLDRIRDSFRALAKGDPRQALAAVRELKDESERETALLAIVSVWRHGELSPPLQRAGAISEFGLEAGLGLELVHDPELAVLWANELTEAEGRLTLLTVTAMENLATNTAAALALAGQFTAGKERQQFLNAMAGAWADKSTDDALNWAQQLPDPQERDGALQAIRQVAPVGIGTQLTVQEGYPVVSGLIEGTPAALSGQLQTGDRIIAIAQGDGRFVPTSGVPLADLIQLIRGQPGTQVQLQVLPAGASLDSPPRIVPLVRDQIRYKR